MRPGRTRTGCRPSDAGGVVGKQDPMPAGISGCERAVMHMLSHIVPIYEGLSRLHAVLHLDLAGSDFWICGVMMYGLLCDYLPFFGENNADALAKVRLGNFNSDASNWKDTFEDAKALIRMVPRMNPEDGYNAVRTLNYEWISSHAPQECQGQARSHHGLLRSPPVLRAPAGLVHLRHVPGRQRLERLLDG